MTTFLAITFLVVGLINICLAGVNLLVVRIVRGIGRDNLKTAEVNGQLLRLVQADRDGNLDEVQAAIEEISRLQGASFK